MEETLTQPGFMAWLMLLSAGSIEVGVLCLINQN